MAQHRFVMCGRRCVNLEHVSSAKWEDDVLFVHTLGDRWVKLTGDDALEMWSILQAVAEQLVKGSEGHRGE